MGSSATTTFHGKAAASMTHLRLVDGQVRAVGTLFSLRVKQRKVFFGGHAVSRSKAISDQEIM